MPMEATAWSLHWPITSLHFPSSNRRSLPLPHSPSPLLPAFRSTALPPGSFHRLKSPLTANVRLGASDSDNYNGVEAANNTAHQLAALKRSLASGTTRYMEEFQKQLRSEIGIDVEKLCLDFVTCIQGIKHELSPWILQAQKNGDEFASWASESTEMIRKRLWPQFVSWNRMELWKDVKSWDAQRFTACMVYMLVVAAIFRGLHNIFLRPRMIKQMANSYMEAVIPEPNMENVRKLRKAIWRKRMPHGFRMQRYIYGPDGALHHDFSFIGENPWDDGADLDDSKFNVEDVINENANITDEKNKELKSTAPEMTDVQNAKEESKAKKTWQDRLIEWDKILEWEEWKDRLLAEDSKFVIPVNLDNIRENLLKKRDKQPETMPPTAYVVSRKWWQYKPKLPYMFFLSKVQRGEVESAVYSEDTTKLYIRLKQGFPAEYIVDVPIDPYLYDLMKNANVKLDILIRNEWACYARAFLILAPSLIILSRIRHLSLRLLEDTGEKIIDLLKMDRKHLILPEDAVQKAKSEYKDVVIGENVWQTVEEIMGYMQEPMRYYDKGIRLPRGILISGPPGTGKTLLARAIARESGLPFVFASGAEFVESSSGDGPEKVFNIFFTARANAPSFIFIDEIDALVGKGVNDDPERRATFDQLLAELDGLPEDTDMDRFSKRQAVVLICATNRPDELHDDFLRPGRIDREIHIGLPGEEERVGIFAVHSKGRRFSKDVDFRKLVFRTVGYSGADVRNLINEAGIMAARKRREEICQQDFIDVLDKQLFEGLGMSMTDEEQAVQEGKVSAETKRLLAIHEAGHVLLAHLFPHYDWHALTHLLPGGKESALSLFYPREETLAKSYTTVGYLKMQMVVAHGGRCAERLVFGDDITDGGQDDLARISKIARELAISYASPRIGLYPLLWKDKLDPPVALDEVELIPNNWNKPGNRIANMTMELSEMFTREVTRYVDETEDEAMRALSTNRHILDALIEELFKRTKMSGLEISDLINSMNPNTLPDYLNNTIPETESAMDNYPKRVGRYEELDIWQAPLHRC